MPERAFFFKGKEKIIASTYLFGFFPVSVYAAAAYPAGPVSLVEIDKMRKKLYILFLIFSAFSVSAQNGEEVFYFLRYPTSSRANALGGNTVALVERDPSLAFHNPGLLGGEMDGMLNLNYMNYVSDINTGSALFAKAHRERGAWAVGISYINNGKFTAADQEGTITGSFSAQDINVQAIYAYDLSEHWRGGLALKFLYSTYEDYTSFGLAADAGLSYYDEDKGFSFGVTLKNIGAQLKAYHEDRQKLPWDIQLGITQKMAHAPIRFSLTAMHLNRWKFDYIDNTDPGNKDSFFQTLSKHLVLGVDLIPSENFWVGIGYNPKRSLDMSLDSGNALSGFSAGTGVKISMFDVGVSFAKYHKSSMAMMLSLSMTLADFRP